jgi:hypothetical protein
MKRAVWITAACFGVGTCVAVSLLMAHKSLDSFLKVLEGEPSIFLLILLGADWAMYANDIGASSGWKGFSETRMYGAAEGCGTRHLSHCVPSGSSFIRSRSV